MLPWLDSLVIGLTAPGRLSVGSRVERPHAFRVCSRSTTNSAWRFRRVFEWLRRICVGGLRGLTFELTPTAEAGGVSPVRDDATPDADRAYDACRSGSGVERGVRRQTSVRDGPAILPISNPESWRKVNSELFRSGGPHFSLILNGSARVLCFIYLWRERNRCM